MSRLTLDLSPADYARLQRLKGATDATTFAAVVRTAIGLYGTIADTLNDGGGRLVETGPGPNGGDATLFIPGLSKP